MRLFGTYTKAKLLTRSIFSYKPFWSIHETRLFLVEPEKLFLIKELPQRTFLLKIFLIFSF